MGQESPWEVIRRLDDDTGVGRLHSLSPGKNRVHAGTPRLLTLLPSSSTKVP